MQLLPGELLQVAEEFTTCLHSYLTPLLGAELLSGKQGLVFELRLLRAGIARCVTSCSNGW